MRRAKTSKNETMAGFKRRFSNHRRMTATASKRRTGERSIRKNEAATLSVIYLQISTHKCLLGSCHCNLACSVKQNQLEPCKAYVFVSYKNTIFDRMLSDAALTTACTHGPRSHTPPLASNPECCPSHMTHHRSDNIYSQEQPVFSRSHMRP